MRPVDHDVEAHDIDLRLAGPIGEHVDRNVVQDDGDQSSHGTLSF
jgi:hypothetical protein